MVLSKVSAGTDWPGYLAGFHAERPGITERVLDRARHARGEGPYAWLADPLRGEDGWILDLACGSAPTRPLLRRQRWVGVDSSASELELADAWARGPVLRSMADALPVTDGSISAVCGAMCLQVLQPLDAVLVEVRRVLWPGGRVVALVPSTLSGPRRGVLGWWKVLRALGIRSQPWPNPGARDGLAGILRAHGFVIDSDERRVFRCPITNTDEATEMVDGLYLPGVDPRRISKAKRDLGAWSGAGRILPLPLRRVVAHLPDSGVS